MAVELRLGQVIIDGEVIEVQILDDGENYENGEGRVPNHEKIEIVYPKP